MSGPVDPWDALREGLEQLGAGEAPKQLPFIDWSLLIPEPKTGRLDFDRFPFQREIYEATASEREVVIKKAAQTGMSALLARWALYWPEQTGATGLYVFPH